MEKDFYKILGVSKNSTPDEIKKAYRKLAVEFHPDKNKSKEAEEKFKGINEAYEVLSNPQKRQNYDRFGSSGPQGGAGGNPFGGGPFGNAQGGQGPFRYYYSSTAGGPFGNAQGKQGFDANDFSDPFDIFEQFFGGGSPFGRRKPAYSITISFMEAVKGVTKKVDLNGKKRDIKIPAGINSDQRIRFDDFDIVVNVQNHDFFERRGNDVISEETIPFTMAILGGIKEIKSLDGSLKLKIPEGTQPDAVIRIKDKGIKEVNGKGRGSHFIKIKVEIPKKINSKQKSLLEEFEKEGSGKHWF